METVGGMVPLLGGDEAQTMASSCEVGVYSKSGSVVGDEHSIDEC